MIKFETCAAAFIFEIELGDTPGELGWRAGPFPWTLPTSPVHPKPRSTTAGARREYFSSRVCGALYGVDDSRPCRWWREDMTECAPDGLQSVGAELLHFETHEGPHGLLVLHADVTGDPVEGLASGKNLHVGPARGWADTVLGRAGRVSPTASRAFATSLFVPSETWSELPPTALPLEGWTETDQWLWELGSATPYSRYPPDPAARDELVGDQVLLSRDWRALVLRDGAAFVGLPQNSNAPFFDSAEVYFRAVYVDTFLLLELQRLMLERFSNAVAVLDDPVRSPADVRFLERGLTTFRNVYWHQQVGTSYAANRIIAAYNGQHRLSQLAEQLYQEVGEYSRQVQLAVSERSTLLLGIITTVGLPFAIAIGILQTLGVKRVPVLLACLGLATVIAGLLVRPLLVAMLVKSQREKLLSSRLKQRRGPSG